MIPTWLQNDYQSLVTLGANQQLHHGLLLNGNHGVGSFDLAQQVAFDLLCLTNAMQACGHCKACHLNQSQTHPDYLLIEPDKDTISVEQVRAISDFFVTSASYQGNKVVIIKNAESLTLSASNALLKTLEEPNKSRYLMLLANNSAALPATILSRCFKKQLTVEHQQAKSFIAGLGIDINAPWVSAFLDKPNTLALWQQQDRITVIESLYAMAMQNDNHACHKQLLELFNQNPDYIDIFVQFYAQKLQSELLGNTLDIKRYQEKSQALLSFADKFKEVKGLNLSLQLNQLLKKLSYL